MGWFFRPDRLVAVPNALTGPVGSRVDLKLLEAGLFSKVDVTGHAVGVVLDPAVAHFDQMTGVVRLVSPGRTVIRFQMGNLKTAVALEAVAAANPEKITIEPHRVELGVGTTAHLKLVGHYKDGSKADLTAAAEWKLHSDQVVCARGGLLEGLAPGAATISARYRANPDSPCLEATANVSVSRIDATSLEIAVEPLPVGVGRGSRLQIDAVAADGKRYSLLESSQLKTAVGPSSLASVHGSILRGDQAGQGLLSATFATGLKAQQDFAVVAIPGLDQLEVHPNKLNLVVGEITDLSSKRPFWWRERGIAPGHGFQGDRLHAEITAAEETAVEWSLDWLTRHQLPDGSWSLKGYTHRCTDATCSGPGIIDADSAATAMGLLPFLAHGETGKRAQVVSSGLAWLVRHQKPDGDLSAGTERQMYAHALATMALCEAFGMTGDQRVGAAAQAAVDFIAAAQNRQTGGWRYHPGEEGDTSVMGWQIMALKGATGRAESRQSHHGVGGKISRLRRPRSPWRPVRLLARTTPHAGHDRGRPTLPPGPRRQARRSPHDRRRQLPVGKSAGCRLPQPLLLVLRHDGHAQYGRPPLGGLEWQDAMAIGGNPERRSQSLRGEAGTPTARPRTHGAAMAAGT